MKYLLLSLLAIQGSSEEAMIPPPLQSVSIMEIQGK
jgi:hypothetical protein